jgi:biopolymer transport protein ExbD
MANIDVGSHGGKRNLAPEVPLVPMIDLLLCCIMFLLVTAVWNQLATMNATGSAPTIDSDSRPPPATRPLVIQLLTTAAVVETPYGTHEEVPNVDGRVDVVRLGERLSAHRSAGLALGNAVNVAADDGVTYREVMATMDTAIGAGFADVTFAP